VESVWSSDDLSGEGARYLCLDMERQDNSNGGRFIVAIVCCNADFSLLALQLSTSEMIQERFHMDARQVTLPTRSSIRFFLTVDSVRSLS
jgi:hypothetical protein